MNEVVKVEIPVKPETARALADPRRAAAAGRLVDEFVSEISGPSGTADRLIEVFEATGRAARAAGLTDEDIDAELAAHRAERRN